jgi:hypothetical protein
MMLGRFIIGTWERAHAGPWRGFSTVCGAGCRPSQRRGFTGGKAAESFSYSRVVACRVLRL